MNNYSRRDFLKAAGLVGGGLMISPTLFAQAAGDVSPSNMLNVALVGIGKQGEVLLDSLLKMPGIKFRAVCDVQPARQRYAAGRIAGIKKDKEIVKHMYEDYRELIANEKDLDAVFIATPDFWHASQTVDFLKAGVNVYCEKMMSNTVEGARSMVRAMRESGKLLQIGHQRKSNPRYHYMRDVLIRKMNICGTITAANGQWNRSPTIKDLELPARYKLSEETLKKYGFANEHQFCNWRWYKDFGGGPISDLGAHQIDIFGWVLGARPKSVYATGGVDFYKNKELPDNVMCIYEYESYQGQLVRAFYQVQTTTGSGGYYESFMGTGGTVRMAEPVSGARVFPEKQDLSGDSKTVKARWESYVAQGVLLTADELTLPIEERNVSGDSRESGVPMGHGIPISLTDPIHMPHINNFFNGIRGTEKLNCDGEHAFESEAAVYKVYDALAAEKKLYFSDADFRV